MNQKRTISEREQKPKPEKVLTAEGWWRRQQQERSAQKASEQQEAARPPIKKVKDGS